MQRLRGAVTDSKHKDRVNARDIGAVIMDKNNRALTFYVRSAEFHRPPLTHLVRCDLDRIDTA